MKITRQIAKIPFLLETTCRTFTNFTELSKINTIHLYPLKDPNICRKRQKQRIIQSENNKSGSALISAFEPSSVFLLNFKTKLKSTIKVKTIVIGNWNLEFDSNMKTVQDETLYFGNFTICLRNGIAVSQKIFRLLSLNSR